MKSLWLWLKRLIFGLMALLVVLPLLGLTYQAVAGWNDERKFPPPGQLIDVGGYRLHLYCLGEGSPTVILDSANMGTVSNWIWV